MSTPEQWLQEQTRQGRRLYLVLDSDGQLDERNGLVSELGVDQYRNLYRGTPADSLANVAPYLFQLDTVEHPALQTLFNTPDRHWGWLASAASADLDALTAHWQNRLVTGERPNQALYRFHDNRVLGRALAYLQPEQRADYLGLIQRLILGSCLALTVGCSAIGKSDTFTLTADLPPDFYYKATAIYIPAKGESCTVPGGRNTHVVFNRKWSKKYQQNSEVELFRTVSGCPLSLYGVNLDVFAKYAKGTTDFGTDYGKVAVRHELDERDKGTFNAAGESEFYGQCQWLFRTSGSLRRIVKILDCKDTDAQGHLTRGHPFAAYTLDQLPGKIVRLKIKQPSEEKPAIGDTWVKVPGGWKRCMGEKFEDQYAFCYGNHKDFSTFRMADGRDTCTIYPGCTENKEVTP